MVTCSAVRADMHMFSLLRDWDATDAHWCKFAERGVAFTPHNAIEDVEAVVWMGYNVADSVCAPWS